METKIKIEKTESEIDDLSEDTASYKITSYPADFTLEVLYQNHESQIITLNATANSYPAYTPQPEKESKGVNRNIIPLRLWCVKG